MNKEDIGHQASTNVGGSALQSDKRRALLKRALNVGGVLAVGTLATRTSSAADCPSNKVDGCACVGHVSCACIGNTGPGDMKPPGPDDLTGKQNKSSGADVAPPTIKGIVELLHPTTKKITLTDGQSYTVPNAKQFGILKKGSAVELRPYGDPSDKKVLLKKSVTK